MRKPLVLLVILVLSCFSFAQKHSEPTPEPTSFVIGDFTYWDFGPPFNYYTLFIVRPSNGSTHVDRVMLTPPGMACLQPAKIEVASASLNESIDSLFGSSNPCAIPDKELRREAEQCKKCVRFSGAILSIRATCGGQDRLIRANVFEDYWVNKQRKIPEHTNAIMDLVGKLQTAVVKPGAGDKPMFDLTEEKNPKEFGKEYSGLMDALSKGEYDSLFETTTEKPSILYRLAQIPISKPSVELSSSSPFRPEVYIEPKYPPIAMAAHIQGEVVVNFDVDWESKAGKIEIEKGHPMLVESVKRAVIAWVFSPQAANSHVHAVLSFKSNCAETVPK